MTPDWIAGSVRARLLVDHAIGLEGAGDLARAGSLDDALQRLSGSAYGRTVHAGLDVAAAERAIAETVLWHLRVLAGWLPPGGIAAMRALAFWFELANVEERLAYLAGGTVPRPFELGGLASLGGRAGDAASIEQLQVALAASAVAGPTLSGDADAVRLALRFAWARRVIATVPEARAWAAGAVALLLARELLLAGRDPSQLAAWRPPLPGAWQAAGDVGQLREALPADASWPLASVAGLDELWRGEVAWRRRVESDAAALARSPVLGRGTVVGAVALLAVDGWRAAAALQAAARGSGRAAVEVFDAVVA